VGPPETGRRGPIGADAKQWHRFLNADGTPYFLIEFECDWYFAVDVENGEASRFFCPQDSASI